VDPNKTDVTNIVTYDSRKGEQVAELVGRSWLGFRLIGRPDGMDGWLCAVESDSYDGTYSLAVLHAGKATPLQLSPQLQESMVDLSSIVGSEIIVPSLRQGTLTIHRYSTDGKLKTRRDLRLAGGNIRGVWSPISISRTGLSAVALRTDVDSRIAVYVFDNTGKLVKQIENAESPSLDSEGHNLAYLHVAREEKYTSAQVMLCDLRDGTVSTVPAMAKPIADDRIPLGRVHGSPVGPLGCTWSPDGQWLVIDYDVAAANTLSGCIALYAIRMNVANCTFCRIPVIVEGDNWVVVDGH
jgi:hypothetical protein